MPVTLNPQSAHGPVSGPIIAGLATFAFTAVGRYDGLRITGAIGFGVIGALITLAVSMKKKTRPAVIQYRLACWVGAALWSAWVLTWASFTLVSLGVFVILVFVAIVGAPVLVLVDEPTSTTPGAASQPPGIPAQWAALISDKVREPVTVTTDHEWRAEAIGLVGYTLQVLFRPGSSLTWTDLSGLQLVLAAAFQLRNGCTVTARPGPQHQGSALLDIAIIDNLDDVVEYPDTYVPRSIRDPLPVGYFGDRSPTLISIFQSSALIGGMPGAGKTVLMKNMLLGCLQCIDTQAWVIDLNGGNLGTDILYDYANGNVDAPSIAAFAPGPHTALILARAANKIIETRRAYYAKLMAEQGVDILPVSALLPGLIIFVDEGGEMMGDEAAAVAAMAAAEIRKALRLGRAMCVRVVLSAQRATSDYIPAQVKKTSAVKIVGMGEDSAEISYMFDDWSKGLSVRNLRQGVWYLRQQMSPIRRFRSWRVMGKQIQHAGRVTGPWRPPMDEPTWAAVGGDITRAWEHPEVTTFLARLRGEIVTMEPADHASTGPSVANLGGAAASEGIARIAAEIQRAETRTAAPLDGKDIDEELAGMATVSGMDEKDVSATARLAYVVEFIAKAGDSGAPTKEIIAAVMAEGFTQRRGTVFDTLNEGANIDLIRNDKFGRWFEVKRPG